MDNDDKVKNTPDAFKINFITWAQQFSGEAAHGADTPVSTSSPSDSKDLHLISAEVEAEEEEEEEEKKRGAQKIGNVGEQKQLINHVDSDPLSRSR